VFRLIDPSSRMDANVKPRRVFAAEVIAGDAGEFSVEPLGDADYEVVAWHSQLGRASVHLAPGQAQVVLHLGSTGVVYGRVLSARRPLAGIDVVSVPDATTFNGADDVTDVKGGDARTGADGRFSVIAAAAGGGQLRIGGRGLRVRRIPLPRPARPVTDLGDIDLAPAMDIVLIVDPDPKCPLRAVGPVGRMGVQIVEAAPAAQGTYRIALPEDGLWEFGLACADGTRTLVPGSVTIGPQDAGREVRFAVR
jgi:hypothetical protein